MNICLIGKHSKFRSQQWNCNVLTYCIPVLVDGAHVQDLIGLIMFKYTEKARKPELKVLKLLQHLELHWCLVKKAKK